MKLANFLSILLVTLTLSAYAHYARPGANGDVATSTVEGNLVGTDIPILNLNNVETLWHESSTVFVDVRSATDYEVGHIAGAINLPAEEFDSRLATLKPRLERAKSIIVYCKSIDCGKSYFCALRLRRDGLAQTKIYPEGWHEWYNRDLPIDRSPF